MSDMDRNNQNLPPEEEWVDIPVEDAGAPAAEALSSDAAGEKKRRRRAHSEEEFTPEERDYRPIRFRRDGKLGCLGGLMYATFVICVSIILACFGWMAFCDVAAINKADISAEVTLPKDIFTPGENEEGDEIMIADIDYVVDSLHSAGIIDFPFLFKLFAVVSNADEKLSPGTYELSTELDYRALVKTMQAGSAAQTVTKITFPEGYTMADIFSILAAKDICSEEDLYEAAAEYNYSYSFLGDMEKGDAARLEGFLFPDTYDFYQGEQAASAINKFLTNFHYKLTADMLNQAENLGLSFREIVIVASMIEKETSGSTEDRANIASVIYNRLAADMPLQIDATVLYDHPDHEGAPTAEMLATDSPHNTHTRPGLPESAISNPGLASIQAALKPADTGYYFYALDEATGEHRFFTNYNDHAAFVATQSYGQGQ